MSVTKLRNYSMALLAFAVPLHATTVSADWDLNMPVGVTPISREVYGLHMVILSVVTVIAICVFGVMIWSIIYHRKSKGVTPARFHHNTVAEVSWTLVPILILVSMAVPATKTLFKMEQTADADVTVKITGYQWKWRYDYLDSGVSFFSSLAPDSVDASQRGSGIDPASVDHYLRNVDKPLVLPVNKKVRLLTTADDVIHAWWVPALGWKRDAIPGFINDNWAVIEEPGTYRGQCAELCGSGHGFMPIVLKAVLPDEYEAWVADMKRAQAAAAASAQRDWAVRELMSKGEEVYKATCSVCHQADGRGLPGTFPALDGSIIVNGPVEQHISQVLDGKNMMPAFRAQLSDVDIATVITYERNSWGNKAGDALQPKDIAAAR